MNSWGFLGNPTPEQVDRWKNLPHGKFKDMVTDLKKKSKGNNLSKYTVIVKKSNESYKTAEIKVEAFTADHALSLAKDINTSNLDWSDTVASPTRVSYEVLRRAW
jgi:hypothetical protein